MGMIDELRGRAKEAVGVLTGNKELTRKGKADKAAGKAKDVVDAVREKAGDLAATLHNATDEGTAARE